MRSPFSRWLLAGALAVVSLSRAVAGEAILLANPASTQPLHIEGSTISRNGSVRILGATESSVQGVGLTRTRVLDRSARTTPSGTVVTYQIVTDRLTRQEDGKPIEVRQPLDGTSATGRRDQTGKWVFFPAGPRVPGDVGQLEFLAAFENRHWLPDREVKPGETWEFPAEFIRRSLQQEIADPDVVGMMKLREIIRNDAGQRQAIIDCVIRGGGDSAGPAGGTAAEGKLSGTLIVDLDRPGSMRLQLTGKFTTAAQRGTESIHAEVPLTIQVRIEPAAAVVR